jgi:hypothetical protein
MRQICVNAVANIERQRVCTELHQNKYVALSFFAKKVCSTLPLTRNGGVGLGEAGHI